MTDGGSIATQSKAIVVVGCLEWQSSIRRWIGRILLRKLVLQEQLAVYHLDAFVYFD